MKVDDGVTVSVVKSDQEQQQKTEASAKGVRIARVLELWTQTRTLQARALPCFWKCVTNVTS